jgi:shikimate dehydrogenase
MNNKLKEKYGVIGDPISHSRSPEIHKLFAQQFNEKIDYNKYHIKADNLKQFIIDFHSSGGRGLNITLPHKMSAMNSVNVLSPNAIQAKAINTIYFNGNEIIGDNTDGIGLIADLRNNFQVEIKNKKILILGAGGAVRGIIGSLIKENPSHIEIANRTISHAEKISKDFSNEASIKTCTIEELNEKGNFDLIINAISFDTNNKDIALSKNIISKSSICYDLSYNSSPTQFMLWAMKNGANFAIQGWGMLIEQAAESYLIWKKIRPDTSAILKQINVTSSSQILRR